MFTGGTIRFKIPASRTGSNTSQTAISQHMEVLERSMTTQNVQNNFLVIIKKQLRL